MRESFCFVDFSPPTVWCLTIFSIKQMSIRHEQKTTELLKCTCASQKNKCFLLVELQGSAIVINFTSTADWKSICCFNMCLTIWLTANKRSLLKESPSSSFQMLSALSCMAGVCVCPTSPTVNSLFGCSHTLTSPHMLSCPRPRTPSTVFYKASRNPASSRLQRQGWKHTHILQS